MECKMNYKTNTDFLRTKTQGAIEKTIAPLNNIRGVYYVWKKK